MLLMLFLTPALLIIPMLLKNRRLNNLLLISGAVFNIFFIFSSIFSGKPIFSEYFRLEKLNSVFLLIQSLVFASAVFYSIPYFSSERKSALTHSIHSALLLLFLTCLNGMLLTSHLGIFWIFIETTTLASAPFIIEEKTRHALEAAWKYIFICSIGISLAFVGITLLSMGAIRIDSLFFADLSARALEIDQFWLLLSFVFILAGFGTKAGLAPMHAWLPDAHSEAPSPVSALLSASLLNGALLGIIRILHITKCAGIDSYPRLLLGITGFISVGICAFSMLRIQNYKRMLAYSSIEHMGISALCLSLGSMGYLPFIIHLSGHSLIKASLFLTSGNIWMRYRSRNTGPLGLLSKDPYTSALWITGIMLILGMPPSPLFFSEFFLFTALISSKLIVPAALLAILLTVVLSGMSKIAVEMIFSGNSDPLKHEKRRPLLFVPQLILLIISICCCLLPEKILSVFQAAAHAL